MRSCAFISWKGHIPSNRHESEPLHAVDVFPTLVEIAGAKAEQPLPLDGRDFSPLVLNNRADWIAQYGEQPRPILLNAEAHRGALRLGDWKLVVQVGDGKELTDSENSEEGSDTPASTLPRRKNLRQKTGAEQYELYQLSSDPSEKANLADREKGKLEELLKYYRQFQAAAQPALATEPKRTLATPAVWGEWEAH